MEEVLEVSVIANINDNQIELNQRCGGNFQSRHGIRRDYS